MSDLPQQPGGRAIGRVLVLVFLGLFLLAGILWLTTDLMSKRRLARYEQQQNFNFADYIPKPVLAESNFALVPVPGVNLTAVNNIQKQFGGSNILGLLNLFSGGGL